MSDQEQPDDDFLEGPLLRQAKGLAPRLETYDQYWRAGAQAIGYREAAETLLDAVIAGEHHTSKTLLHPILFLYRHSIELRLKGLINEYGSDLAPTRHELDALYAAAKQVIQRYAPNTYFDKVDRIIAELHAIDPNSQTFRYATTRKGDPIEIGVSEVDLVHLRSQMDDLDTFFFGVETDIDQAQEYLTEVAEYHRP
ncbi:MAG TPA: hypothetical protein VKY24_08715 [Reyranella sp.]|jgi:hypothetical protein|nr:hypothetical protein [Reyranella sp.]